MKITVHHQNRTKEIVHKVENSILQTLQEAGMVINAPCGGNGRCGKCKIQFLDITTEATKLDEKVFTKEQLKEGYRLACRAYPKENCEIIIYQETQVEMEILSEYTQNIEVEKSSDAKKYGIAVDIGTTTIAMQVVEIPTMKVIYSYTMINSQKIYGADVISRIQTSNQGKGEILQKQMINDLKKGMEKLLENKTETIEIMVISANTTMIHLLLGYSCKTLGVFPFQPINTDTVITTYEKLFGEATFTFPIKIIPGISAFVGGDIMSGMLVCGFSKKQSISILIDLGTNGELAIGNNEKIFVTSTAAGPAFEGGNITCGIGSIPGAICHVNIKAQRAEVDTISDESPCGICGTGVIEAVYELLKNAMIDETGLLEEKYFETGFLLAESKLGEEILLTQKDIREIQLAKAAIHAGIQTLLLRYETSWDNIENVYLAGGFGYKMDLEKAIGIGLLPKEAKDKVVIVGNTSLAGGCYFMNVEEAETEANYIKEIAQEINLSEDTAFGEYYMEQMYFY